jgi:hypothetical protein
MTASESQADMARRMLDAFAKRKPGAGGRVRCSRGHDYPSDRSVKWWLQYMPIVGGKTLCPLCVIEHLAGVCGVVLEEGEAAPDHVVKGAG